MDESARTGVETLGQRAGNISTVNDTGIGDVVEARPMGDITPDGITIPNRPFAESMTCVWNIGKVASDAVVGDGTAVVDLSHAGSRPDRETLTDPDLEHRSCGDDGVVVYTGKVVVAVD